MSAGTASEAERATRLYEEALERDGVEDLRPGFRQLVVRLRNADTSGYDEALRRYETELVPSVARGEVEPLVAWIAYGVWLAGRLEAGRTVAVDPTGSASSLPDSPRLSDVILFLPERGGRAILLAAPREPSDAQQATMELLVR